MQRRTSDAIAVGLRLLAECGIGLFHSRRSIDSDWFEFLCQSPRSVCGLVLLSRILTGRVPVAVQVAMAGKISPQCNSLRRQ